MLPLLSERTIRQIARQASGRLAHINVLRVDADIMRVQVEMNRVNRYTTDIYFPEYPNTEWLIYWEPGCEPTESARYVMRRFCKELSEGELR